MKIKVQPYGLESYAIYYKNKWWECWRNFTEVFDYYDDVDKFFPVLFDSFEEACALAKKLKANPELIEQHNSEQKKIYLDLKPKIIKQKQIQRRQTAIF